MFSVMNKSSHLNMDALGVLKAQIPTRQTSIVH